MSDKTCGTCANGKPALVRCTVHGDEFPWLKKRNEACDDFCERADSLEALALDMLALIRAAKQHPIVLKPNAIRGGQIMQPDPDNVFAERLEALGVKP